MKSNYFPILRLSNNGGVIVLISFLVFALSLSMRDVLFRYMLVNENSLSLVCFGTGIFSLLFSVVFIDKVEMFKIVKPKVQFIRLIMNCFSWTLIIYIFSLLEPSITSILTKSGMPLAIIFGAVFGHSFLSKEKKLAVVILFLIFSFAFLSTQVYDDIPLSTLMVLAVAIVLTVFEFMFISKSVRDENKFYIWSTPSVALILSGLFLMDGDFSSILNVDIKLLTLLFFSGLMFFLSYYTSMVRYKYLPPGLAEYPSLLTYFILLPIDLILFDGVFNVIVFLNAVVILLLMSNLIKERLK